MQIHLLGATGRTGHPRSPRRPTARATPSPLWSGTRPALEQPHLHPGPRPKGTTSTVRTGSPLPTIRHGPSHRNVSRQNTWTWSSPPLNARRGSDNPFAAPHTTESPPRMMADSIANVISALTHHHQQQQEQQQQQNQQQNQHTGTVMAQSTAAVAGRRPTKLVVLSALGAGSSARSSGAAICVSSTTTTAPLRRS